MKSIVILIALVGLIACGKKNNSSPAVNPDDPNKEREIELVALFTLVQPKPDLDRNRVPIVLNPVHQLLGLCRPLHHRGTLPLLDYLLAGAAQVQVESL